jgi:hypothetical protein
MSKKSIILLMHRRHEPIDLIKEYSSLPTQDICVLSVYEDICRNAIEIFLTEREHNVSVL